MPNKIFRVFVRFQSSTKHLPGSGLFALGKNIAQSETSKKLSVNSAANTTFFMLDLAYF
jgi:hypothetical protein